MEDRIIDVVQNLMGGILAFIGLIFTSLGIILNIKDDWKMKRLRKSSEFVNFVSMNVWCVNSVILLLLCSFVIIFCTGFIFWSACIIYVILLLVILFLLIRIVLRYNQLIILLNDDAKPELSIEKDSVDY